MRINPVLIGFIRKELIQTLRDKKSWVILFVVPVLQLILFGMAVSTEMKDIKLGAVYAPNDSLCRRLTERFYSSRWFVPAGGADRDPFHWIQSGRADAVLVAPPGGLTQAAGRGQGRIQLLINGSNVLKCQSIESYASAILEQSMAAEKTVPEPPPPLNLDIRILYNPQLESPVFLVPGVISNILGILTIILTATAFAREVEGGTFETLIASPAQPWEILLGKTIPYVILAMLDGPLVLAAALWGFNVPMRGSYLVLAAACFTFVVTTVAIGILLSTLAKTQQQAGMTGFIFLFPAITLSGLAFPVENMPGPLRLAAYLDPFQYFVELLHNIMLKGGDPGLVARDLGILALLAGAAVFLTLRRFKRTLN
jgi:ABC-2 type transport system permease protein